VGVQVPLSATDSKGVKAADNERPFAVLSDCSGFLRLAVLASAWSRISVSAEGFRRPAPAPDCPAGIAGEAERDVELLGVGASSRRSATISGGRRSLKAFRTNSKESQLRNVSNGVSRQSSHPATAPQAPPAATARVAVCPPPTPSPGNPGRCR